MLGWWLSSHHVGQLVACEVVGGLLASTEVCGVAVEGELECSVCLEPLVLAGHPGLLAVLACGHQYVD